MRTLQADGLYRAGMSTPTPTSSTQPERPASRRDLLAALGRQLLPALIASAIAGFLVGGVGGRLAMFVLRLTSRAEVIGVESDDGFIIGRFSIDTLNLLLGATIVATLVIGPIFALLRLWLPQRLRSPIFALFFGLVGGATIVHADGVDFQVLSPRLLAIGLFVALPAAFGAVLEPLRGIIERSLPRLPDLLLIGVVVLGSGWPLLLGVGVNGLVVGAVVWGAVLLGPAERIGSALISRPTTWLGRLLMGVFAMAQAGDLVEDMQALL